MTVGKVYGVFKGKGDLVIGELTRDADTCSRFNLEQDAKFTIPPLTHPLHQFRKLGLSETRKDVIIYDTMRAVSVSEMQELDFNAIEEIGIPSIVLMENAGRCVSEIAMDMLGTPSGKRVAIFCGTGNNGGDGLVAARHLFNIGVKVSVYLVGRKSALKNDPKINAGILEKIGVKIKEISGPVSVDRGLIIDAIFGIGLKGEVKEPAKGIIIDINKKTLPVISADVPSGLDADTGKVLGVAIKAHTTVTMQFPKKGFYLIKGPEHAGKIITVDIGIPKEF